jgi:hypothetical protein
VPAGTVETWSHTASDVLGQVGGQADEADPTPSTAVVWQC